MVCCFLNVLVNITVETGSPVLLYCVSISIGSSLIPGKHVFETYLSRACAYSVATSVAMIARLLPRRGLNWQATGS